MGPDLRDAQQLLSRAGRQGMAGLTLTAVDPMNAEERLADLGERVDAHRQDALQQGGRPLYTLTRIAAQP